MKQSSIRKQSEFGLILIFINVIIKYTYTSCICYSMHTVFNAHVHKFLCYV